MNIDNMVTAEKLKITCSVYGIKMFWKNCEVTKNTGLNIAVNTLGLWTDSSKADWQVVERGINFLKVKVVFRELPLNQLWRMSLEREGQIYWEVDMEVEEPLHIDELRMLCMVNPRYKNWLNKHQEKPFPRLDGQWRNLCLDNFSSTLVGVKFPAEGKFLPSLTLEPQDDKQSFFPIIQNPPLSINAHIVGIRDMVSEDKKNYLPGNYHIFSGRINLFEKDNLLDRKIEGLRGDYFKSILKKKIKKRKLKKVLLVNLPWQKDGKWGVRAGSRWPHIKDVSEGNYLPFPFFLAYATSLLRKNDIEADMIDAIAEQIPEDKFIEDISRRDFDILVTETSVPSFYHDMRLLKKISCLDIPVVLSGPHPGIYKLEFLEKNGLADYVLFGEYEFSLLELIKAVSKGKRNLSFIRGLIWKDNNDRVIKNLPPSPFDINNLPWPYRDGMPMQKYWDLPGNISHPSAQMVASRGCPFSCNFCLWPQILFGRGTYRARDIKDCIDEMEFLIREKGFKSIYWDDDTFNIGKRRMLKFCEEIIKRGLSKTPWAIMAKADLMDEEILNKMKEAGLHAVKYGIESASQDLIDNCGKGLDLKKTERTIEYTRALGIKAHLTFSFGLPGETKETLKRTIDYALKLDPQSIQFSIITPFPGTALFEELDRKGKILSKDWSLYDGHYSCVFQPDNLTSAELEETKQYAYRLWADAQRKKRGLRGDVKRFFQYYQRHGLKGALGKTTKYLDYLFFQRKKFIGKI